MAKLNTEKNTNFAGQSVKQGDYTVTYNENGYVTSAVLDGGKSASSYTPQNTNASATHQAAYQAAQSGDWDKAATIVNGLATDDGYGGKSMKEADAYWQELTNGLLYNPDDYYKGKYESTYGEGSWSGNGQTTGTQATNQTTKGTTGGYGSFSDFLNGVGYDDYAEQTRKYIQAAVDNAVNGYNRQIDTVNSDTKELARQAYIANMLGQKNMDQQLSASGLAGGMADSQRIGLQANYENDLNELERQRAETVAELELAIENAKLTGDMQTAQELAGFLQQVQSQWVGYMQNQQQMENQNYWNKMNMDQENQNTARNWVLTMIQNGTMPDEDTLTAAGMTKADAQNILNYVKQQNAPKPAAVEPVKYTAAQAETALAALLAGNNDQTAKAIVEAYYQMPVNTVLAAYGTTPEETEPSDAGGMKSNYYKTYENSILQTAQQGYANNAAGMVDAIWNQLNEEQKKTLQQKLAALGLEYQPE